MNYLLVVQVFVRTPKSTIGVAGDSWHELATHEAITNCDVAAVVGQDNLAH